MAMVISEIGGVIAGVKFVNTAVRAAAETAKAAGKSEVVADLLEVQTKMMEFLAKHQELFEENLALKAEIAELKETLRDKAVVEHHYNAYWKRVTKDKLDGPYSMYTWDKETKLVRMRYYDAGGGESRFICYATKNVIKIPTRFLQENNVDQANERP